jgi:ATP-binding protein involved in chromosome partitioning
MTARREPLGARPLLERARGNLGGRRVIAVLAGKGGVGKSVIAVLLARARDAPLADLDIFSFAALRMLGAAGRLHEVSRDGIEPIVAGGVRVFSVGGIVGDRYVVLPGASQAGVVEALLAFAKLGDSGELVVDMPPGAGEELLALMRVCDFVPVIVTTPSAASYRVVRHALNFLLDRGRGPAAVVLNMAYIECCGRRVYPFGRGAEVLDEARRLGAPVIEVPLDPSLEEYIGRLHEYRGPVYDAVVRLAELLG